MTRRDPKNISASVKSRLLNLARERHEEFNLLLLRYGIERLLYRLTHSEYANAFVLKGAMLFQLFAHAPHRPTKDVDLLGKGSSDLARIEDIIRQVAQLDVADDGLSFDASTVHAERIKEDQEYEGIRVTLTAYLGSARIPLQIDVGFGDAITPRPKKQVIPCILDFEAPRLAVYPWETVVAEKYQALVELGMANSRMKDFFDLHYMANQMSFEGPTLAKAVAATFKRRKTKLPESIPLALTSSFVDDETVSKRWLAFLRRLRLDRLSFAEVTNNIWTFLGPVTASLISNDEFDKLWNRGGPWR